MSRILAAQETWQPAAGPLKTRWSKDVAPAKAHPEYPRPQMVRKDWLNLNGLWDYSITARDAAQPESFPGKILVPFPVESALSGVMKTVTEKDRIWYRRSFQTPKKWSGQRVLLHFGAVDFEATVWVNGRPVGQHRGGYDTFSFDVTDALQKSGANALVVAVWDPTDAGPYARGKQVRKPDQGIFYTACSGIWQTVWLEPVPAAHLESVKITPDIDRGMVTIGVKARSGPGQTSVRVAVYDGRKKVTEGEVSSSVAQDEGTVAPQISLAIPAAKLWSPDSPFLYDLRITLAKDGQRTDEVRSYFGMRKVALGKDEQGITKIFLNNKPFFMVGPLDQGFWPDGIYTAPTDAALRYDIEVTKSLIQPGAQTRQGRAGACTIGPTDWGCSSGRTCRGDRFIGGRDPTSSARPSRRSNSKPS